MCVSPTRRTSITALVIVLTHALAVSVLSACNPVSSLEDDQPVEVTGNLKGPEGAISSRRVVLDTGLSLFDAAEIIDAGLEDEVWLCFEDDPPTSCDASRRTETDGGGAYRFELLGEDTKDSAGLAIDFSVLVQWEPAPAGTLEAGDTVAGFYINRSAVAVPAMEAWEPRMESSVAADGATTLSYTTFEADLGARPSLSNVHVIADNHRSIAVGAATGSTTWSAEILADYDTSWELVTDRKTSAAGVDFDLRYTSPRVALPRGTLVPLSRGAECRVSKGDVVTFDSSGDCSFTDGDIWSTAFSDLADRNCPPDPACQEGCTETPSCPALVEINFDEPVTFDTIVIRYFGSADNDPPPLAGWAISRDGESWTDLQLSEPPSEARGGYRLLKTSSSVEALHLRISDAQFLDRVGELDLF